MDSGKEDTCDHEPWKYPSWLSTNTKMEAIRLSMDTDADTFNREQKYGTICFYFDLFQTIGVLLQKIVKVHTYNLNLWKQ